jgi:hypothetical protein
MSMIGAPSDLPTLRASAPSATALHMLESLSDVFRNVDRLAGAFGAKRINLHGDEGHD